MLFSFLQSSQYYYYQFLSSLLSYCGVTM